MFFSHKYFTKELILAALCQVWPPRPCVVPGPGLRLSSVRSPEPGSQSRAIFPDSRDPGPVWWQPGPGEQSRDNFVTGDVTRDICQQLRVCWSHKSDGVSDTKWCQECESDESRVSTRGNVTPDTGNIKRENDKTNFNFVFVSPNYKNQHYKTADINNIRCTL